MKELFALLPCSVCRKLYHRPELLERLRFLVSESEEEEEDYVSNLPESLATFADFMVRNTELADPDVGLTPKGEIEAQWGHAPARSVVLEFCDSGKIRYVLSRPKDSCCQRPYGVATTKKIWQILTRFPTDLNVMCGGKETLVSKRLLPGGYNDC